MLIDAIESRGGLVVGQTFRGIAHYAVVPLHGAKMSQTAVETVSYLWVVSTICVCSVLISLDGWEIIDLKSPLFTLLWLRYADGLCSVGLLILFVWWPCFED